MWVLLAKHDSNGWFSRMKGRLTVLGNQERDVVSKALAYAPVAAAICIRQSFSMTTCTNQLSNSSKRPTWKKDHFNALIENISKTFTDLSYVTDHLCALGPLKTKSGTWNPPTRGLSYPPSRRSHRLFLNQRHRLLSTTHPPARLTPEK